ncbi:lipoxygenase family protein [Polyangium sorediatum]|uniref:Lipoxygenase family protein n=1 Tax=Polyangium sorediatum TaxID=889274 RepID=A0ABT6NVP7_9BACT|nr:lipoxygenase family protein [Polyangium sorediatum]MDI1432364.1 lipoxygenase family protein [Polyangium sorediatum]
MSTEPSSPASSASYQYNYTYVPPLAMADSVPKSQEPALVWWIKVAWEVLLIAKNRLAWKVEQGRSEQPNGAQLPTTEAERASILDLGHLGLGQVNLSRIPSDHSIIDKLSPNAGGLEAATLDAAEAIVFCKRLASKAIEQELKDPLELLRLVLDSLMAKPEGRPQSLQAYQDLFVTLPLPWAAQSFQEDATFAWMQVAGFNPLVLQKVTDPRRTLGISDAELAASLGDGDGVEAALAEGRLYIADYARLARVVNGNFPDGPKYCFAPRALFGLPRGKGRRRLVPLGIRWGQDDALFPLFTPADGEAWLQAKTAVEVAAFNDHEMVAHLGHTHLLVEPFVVATHRNLPNDHPVSLLLRPHFEGTLFINNAAQSTLIAPGYQVDKLLGGTIQASRAVAVASLIADPDFDFNKGMLPQDLARRDVNDPALEYPYRDDALMVWGAIEKWVRSYVGVHYKSDAEVQADAALQAWSAELVAQDGGRVKGFGEGGVAGKLTTVAYLVEALTMLVFTASAQHAAVNFAQGGLMTFTPLAPGAGYRAALVSREDAARNPLLDQFPPLDMGATQLDFLTLLGSVHYTKLGDYRPLHFHDLRVLPHLLAFQEELKKISAVIEDRNASRLGPYPYLDPPLIPQSINI